MFNNLYILLDKINLLFFSISLFLYTLWLIWIWLCIVNGRIFKKSCVTSWFACSLWYCLICRIIKRYVQVFIYFKLIALIWLYWIVYCICIYISAYYLYISKSNKFIVSLVSYWNYRVLHKEKFILAKQISPNWRVTWFCTRQIQIFIYSKIFTSKDFLVSFATCFYHKCMRSFHIRYIRAFCSKTWTRITSFLKGPLFASMFYLILLRTFMGVPIKRFRYHC